MADPAANWSSMQENEFPNFPANDSFNLNEMTGFDGMLLQSHSSIYTRIYGNDSIYE